MINCAGVIIEKMSKRYGVKIGVMPNFAYQKYCTTGELRDYLKSMGLIVTYDDTKSMSFYFKDLQKHNITMLISYNSINRDSSKHVEIVQDMDKDNRVKLPHIERYISQDEFGESVFTFVSDRDITGIVDFF
jgi:hypothetical protein